MITLDFDSHYSRRNKRQLSANFALDSYNRMHNDKPKRQIEIWISPSRNGFHLVRYGDDGTLRNEIKLRLLYGDDLTRIAIDKYKLSIGSSNHNVLWNDKYGKRAKKIRLGQLKRFARGETIDKVIG